MRGRLTAAILTAACLHAPAAAAEPMQHGTDGAARPLWDASTAQQYPSKPAKTRAAEWLRLTRHYRDSGHLEVWSGVPKWIRELGLCIRRHESINAGHYRAHNGTSSAAGAYQMLDRFWRGNAKWAKHDGRYVARHYQAANHAPAWVQDVVFIHSIRNGGSSAWRGTGCPGT